MALQSARLALERHAELESAILQDVRCLVSDGQGERDRSAARPKVAVLGAPGGDRRRLAEILNALRAETAVHETLGTLRDPLLRGEFDLVITDVTLADANWADVLRLIVRASLRTAILVHSRALNEKLRSEALWRGAQGILVPPHSMQSVSGVFRHALLSIRVSAE